LQYYRLARINVLVVTWGFAVHDIKLIRFIILCNCIHSRSGGSVRKGKFERTLPLCFLFSVFSVQVEGIEDDVGDVSIASD